MVRSNQSMRLEAAGSGIKLWQIAERLGYNDCYFSRLLRKELSDELKERAQKAIKELQEEQSCHE